MFELNTSDVFSYTANIVFVTWGIVAALKDRKYKREQANLFNAAYEMANKLSHSLDDAHSKAQGENIASFLKATTRNLMNRKFDKVSGESNNFFFRFLERKSNKSKKSKQASSLD